MEVHPVVKTEIYCVQVKVVNKHKIMPLNSAILEEHPFFGLN